MIRSSFLLILLTILGIYACQNDDEIDTNPALMLEFSTDTLTFDTVFTSIGSATRILKLYNRNSKAVEIQSISIESGQSSKFRLNIDGEPSNAAQNIVIPGEDSLYVFGEVTVDPDAPLSESPFVIEDAIILETNGNTQKVVLEAWGQNANYIPERFFADSIRVFSCNGAEVVWDDPKPYVIYGIIGFDNCKLLIAEGTQIYVHGGLTRVDDQGETFFYNDGRIVIGPNSSLRSQGTADNPVVFQGDRLEQEFDEISGQWYGIIFNAGSIGNSLNYTTIKNSVQGVVIDSLGELELMNSQIFNTSSNAIFTRHATVKAENCLFYDNGATSVRTSLGGNLTMDYCTVAAFGNDQQSIFLTNGQCFGQLSCAPYLTNDLNATLTNCIFYGSNSDQVGLSEFDESDFNYLFDHCIVRVEDLLKEENHPDFFEQTNQTLNVDRDVVLFEDENEDEYRLDSLSVAEGLAKVNPLISIDLDNNTRDVSTPDIGCFEYQY